MRFAQHNFTKERPLALLNHTYTIFQVSVLVSMTWVNANEDSEEKGWNNEFFGFIRPLPKLKSFASSVMILSNFNIRNRSQGCEWFRDWVGSCNINYDLRDDIFYATVIWLYNPPASNQPLDSQRVNFWRDPQIRMNKKNRREFRRFLMPEF